MGFMLWRMHEGGREEGGVVCAMPARSRKTGWKRVEMIGPRGLGLLLLHFDIHTNSTNKNKKRERGEREELHLFQQRE